MRTENIVYFTENEEEYARLLVAIGVKRQIAKTLVFLSSNPAATSREIERGTDLRQPEVSVAVGEMLRMGWIRVRESMVRGQGRPIKIYELQKKPREILDALEKKKEVEAERQRQMIQKLRILSW